MKPATALLVLLLAALLLSGCTRESAEEIYSTAKFEELQNNREHAIQLYEKIAKEYPDSEYGRKARERISELKKRQ